VVTSLGDGNGRRNDRQHRRFGLGQECIECGQRGRHRGRETRADRALGAITVPFVVRSTTMMVMPGVRGRCAPRFEVLDEFGL
jgi:hypothetical protein